MSVDVLCILMWQLSLLTAVLVFFLSFLVAVLSALLLYHQSRLDSDS